MPQIISKFKDDLHPLSAVMFRVTPCRPIRMIMMENLCLGDHAAYGNEAW